MFGLRHLLGLGLLALSVTAAPQPHKKRTCSTKCFPNGNATISDATATKRTRENWWCPADKMYGFMGFSYPLEVSDCGDASNGFDKINSDFKKMKEMGASMVRVYAPECREKSVWENLLKAGIENNMGIIGMVWWGFGDQGLWVKTRDSINAVLEENPLAPFVFHSMAFGSEPVGDGVEDDGTFVKDMLAWKDTLSKYGINLGISEDWDRQGRLTDGDGLTDFGKQIRDASDNLQLHPMPYYHCDKYPTADNVMDYFSWYIEKLVEPNMPGLPIFVTETQWSSQQGGSHNRGCGEPGEDLDNFKKFWNTWQDNCDYWKQHKVGWFAHTFSDEMEGGFGILDGSGNPKMDFAPPRC
ncbi:B-(1-6) glucan synthase [Exidia glandulosa HHB12029]|uniref:glucan endo-1,3-beta-D-glucosidase n=1 Tax=Exidia glandulosa HHB12029 TaxID=1314781 RepID=A0A165JIH4_EXIGL|nr:B-(1-6) glucan synthase [Exidia glandulosa HHB12029]